MTILMVRSERRADTSRASAWSRRLRQGLLTGPVHSLLEPGNSKAIDDAADYLQAGSLVGFRSRPKSVRPHGR
jgi:hypothetical protein